MPAESSSPVAVHDRVRRPARREVSGAVVSPADAHRVPDATSVPLPAGAVLRAVPFLELVQTPHVHLIAVGQSQVLVGPGGTAGLTVVVRALWRSTDAGGPREDGAPLPALSGWQPVEDHELLADVLDRLVEVVGPLHDRDPAVRATRMAKALAERSRNAVADLRLVRYQLEDLLAREIRAGGNASLETVLTDMLELTTASGRARDEAREARREGLWTWRTDDAAYHAHRRTADPTLPPRPGDRGGRRRPWFGSLDAGVRQCASMDEQLREETSLLQSLLGAAPTIAVTRDTRAQETFNLVATVGAVLIGGPALVLGLYGASAVLPLSGSGYLVLVPLAVAGLIAAGLAALLPGRDRTGKLRRFGVALLAVLVTLVLLALSGVLMGEVVAPAPAAPPAPSAPAPVSSPGPVDSSPQPSSTTIPGAAVTTGPS